MAAQMISGARMATKAILKIREGCPLGFLAWIGQLSPYIITQRPVGDLGGKTPMPTWDCQVKEVAIARGTTVPRRLKALILSSSNSKNVGHSTACLFKVFSWTQSANCNRTPKM